MDGSTGSGNISDLLPEDYRNYPMISVDWYAHTSCWVATVDRDRTYQNKGRGIGETPEAALAAALLDSKRVKLVYTHVAINPAWARTQKKRITIDDL